MYLSLGLSVGRQCHLGLYLSRNAFAWKSLCEAECRGVEPFQLAVERDALGACGRQTGLCIQREAAFLLAHLQGQLVFVAVHRAAEGDFVIGVLAEGERLHLARSLHLGPSLRSADQTLQRGRCAERKWLGCRVAVEEVLQAGVFECEAGLEMVLVGQSTLEMHFARLGVTGQVGTYQLLAVVERTA